MDNKNRTDKFPEPGNFSASPNNFKNNYNAIKQNNNQKINNNQNHINPIEEKVIKEGAKAAANAVAGPAAGAAVDAIAKTELGKQAMQGISSVAKKPLKRLGLSNKGETEEAEGNFDEEIGNKIIKFGAVGTLGIGGCLSFIIIVIVVVIFLSPLIYVNDIMDNLNDNFGAFGEQLGNFLTFRGWCTDEDCQEKEKNNFYEKIAKAYEDYDEKLNVNLLTATLTYVDPFTTEDEENITNENGEFDISNLPSSGFVDFKKSTPKIKDLASHMVVKKDGIWNLDIEGYRNYLEESFIRKFYFDNKQGHDIDLKVEQAIDDIFSRVELFERMNESNKSDNFVLNNAKVTILDCNNGMVIDEVSLYEYLQGVLYLDGYAVNHSEEFLKAMAIVVKNHLYVVNGATPNSMPNNLRIASCQKKQGYCSVNEGCHEVEDVIDDNYNTVVTGPNSDGEYHLAPLTDVEVLEKIKSAIDSTFTQFIVKNGEFVNTQYYAQCTETTCDSTTNIMDQLQAHQMVINGSSYVDVINYFYDGVIESLNINITGYPLDLEHNYITSAYGWRVHPISGCCSYHGGTDISAPGDANIYSVADGVIVLNEYHWSYGNYVIVGHGIKNNETGYYEYYSLYAHQIRLSSVKVGENVKAGEKIGNVGSTGSSTGNHLHIEIYTIENGVKKRQDAVEYFKNVELQGFVGGAIYESERHCISQSGRGSC